MWQKRGGTGGGEIRRLLTGLAPIASVSPANGGLG